jgi:predicted pyridoxine 5'-phosphate oxidase superfamily flavin-nucleotide-binding protein
MLFLFKILMSVITSEIKNFLDVQKLGYVATVSSDGKPNISPKGTIIAWSSTVLAFADIRSPDTMMNLQNNPFVEINVIDPLSRMGYLFSVTAKIINDTTLYDDIITHYRNNGIQSAINSIVIVDVSSVSIVTSPLYDLGKTEDEIKLKWKKYFSNL